MIGSHWMFRIWADRLYRELIGCQFVLGLSFQKDSVILQFKVDNRLMAYELKFINGFMALLPSNNVRMTSKKKSNAVVQFKDLEGKTVENIQFALFDRLLTIAFNNGSKLVLKGFGKFSNILEYADEQSKPTTIFRLNLKKDWNLTYLSLSKTWTDGSNSNHNVSIDSPNQWNELFPGLKWDIAQTHYSSNNIEELISILANPTYYRFKLSSDHQHILLKIDSDNQWPSDKLANDLDEVIRTHLRTHFFIEERNQLKAVISKKVKSLESNLRNIQKRKNKLKEQRSFRELGDLVLAHAHSIKKGVSEALISDFFTGQRIRIKINPNLTAAENAQKFYRKSKNEQLEWDHVTSNENYTESCLEEFSEYLNKINDSTQSKDLTRIREAIRPNSNPKEKQQTTTYKILRLDDYDLWLGKNAKSNDDLLRKAHKNDLWFHAADVTGSHVLIRTNGKTVSSQQIEIAAQLAAYHSKGRSQPLQTVQFTHRKFLSKPKNAAPGEVKVAQFETIDVCPKDLKF